MVVAGIGALFDWASCSNSCSSSSSSESSSLSISTSGGGSSSATLVCCAPSVGATTGVFSDGLSSSGKIVVSLFNCSSPDSLKGGGILPLRVSVSCFAACITASCGVTVGEVFLKVEGYDAYPRFKDAEAARVYLTGLDLHDHMILIKGSRGIRLEVLKDLF